MSRFCPNAMLACYNPKCDKGCAHPMFQAVYTLSMDHKDKSVRKVVGTLSECLSAASEIVKRPPPGTLDVILTDPQGEKLFTWDLIKHASYRGNTENT